MENNHSDAADMVAILRAIPTDSYSIPYSIIRKRTGLSANRIMVLLWKLSHLNYINLEVSASLISKGLKYLEENGGSNGEMSE